MTEKISRSNFQVEREKTRDLALVFIHHRVEKTVILYTEKLPRKVDLCSFFMSGMSENNLQINFSSHNFCAKRNFFTRIYVAQIFQTIYLSRIFLRP